MHKVQPNVLPIFPEITDSNYSVDRLASVLESVYQIDENDKRIWRLAQYGEQSVHEILQHWILGNLTQLDEEMASDLVRFLCRRFEAISESKEV